MENSKFEGWAIVEVMGHNQYAGYVTTEVFGGTVLFRVEVPELPEVEEQVKGYEYDDNGRTIPFGSTIKRERVPGFSKLIGAGSIYAITPCDQQAAELAARHGRRQPLTVLRLASTKQLPPAELVNEEDQNDADRDFF